jgi:hypothetical protein
LIVELDGGNAEWLPLKKDKVKKMGSWAFQKTFEPWKKLAAERF